MIRVGFWFRFLCAAVGHVPLETQAAAADAGDHQDQYDVAGCDGPEGKLVHHLVARPEAIAADPAVHVVDPVVARDHPREHEEVERYVEEPPAATDAIGVDAGACVGGLHVSVFGG